MMRQSHSRKRRLGREEERKRIVNFILNYELVPSLISSAVACKQGHMNHKLPFPRAESGLKPEGDIEYQLSYLDVLRYWFIVLLYC